MLPPLNIIVSTCRLRLSSNRLTPACSRQDAWTSTLLYPLMDVVGPALPVPYFTLLVLFGAFFAMQLLVAILSSKFAQLSAQVGDSVWVDLCLP